MFFLLTGASGGGKSVALQGLQKANPQIAWHDFDDIGVPAHAGKTWRHQALNQWLEIALTCQSQGQDMGLGGQAPFGESLASPRASQLNGIADCLLDCGDVVRIDRLRGRNAQDRGISQEMLNWAAWHRMHVADPQWRQDVLREEGESGMHWERWEQWQREMRAGMSGPLIPRPFPLGRSFRGSLHGSRNNSSSPPPSRHRSRAVGGKRRLQHWTRVSDERKFSLFPF